jgi:hypothetical protein
MRPYRKRSTKAPIPTVKIMNNWCERHLIPRGGIAKIDLKIVGMMECKIGVCQLWKGF